jgi:hypothetical protein
LHGPGTQTSYGVQYEDAKYLVFFEGGNVWNIEIEWNGGDGASLDDARQESGELLPSDSELVRTYSPVDDPALIVDLYKSVSLIDRFDPAAGTWWIGGEPGDFVVIHERFGKVIAFTVIDTGNNP